MLAVCVLSVGGLPCDTTHVGDLVLQGNDVLLIDGETYCQTGDIRVQDNAQLLITSGTLVFNQSYHGEYHLRISGDARFEVVDGDIESDFAYGFYVSDQAEVRIVRSPTTEAQFQLGGSSSLTLEDSDILIAQLWGGATLTATDSFINELVGWAGGTAVADITAIRPGLFPDWDLRTENTIANWDIDITLINTRVDHWGFGAEGSSTLQFDDCRFGLDARDTSDVIVRNSDLTAVGLTFHDGQTILLEDLRTGYMANWDAHSGIPGDPGTRSVVIENCNLERYWNVWNTGADLTVRNCELGYLWSADSIAPTTVVEGSTIESLVFAEHEGTVSMDGVIVTERFFPPSGCTSNIVGEVEFQLDELTFEEGVWSSSEITREYPVFVLDDTGAPAVGVVVELHAPGGALVWSDDTDGTGSVSPTIAFDDGNYDDTWTLSVPSYGASEPIRLLTDTPVVFQEFICDLNGDGVLNFLDVRILLQAVWGVIELTEEQQAMADINGDGELTMADVFLLAAIVIGIGP